MSAHAIHFDRHLFSTTLEPVARWFAEIRHSAEPQKAAMRTKRENSVRSRLIAVKKIDKVAARTQELAQLAEQLRRQVHQQAPMDPLTTVNSLTHFCRSVSEELEPIQAVAEISAARAVKPNNLSQEAIQEFIVALLENRRSVENFMTAFLTASYQRPNGYQLCLSMVGSRNDLIGRAGIEVLRNLGLMSFKQLPELMMASAIAAVVNCCWSLERAAGRS